MGGKRIFSCGFVNFAFQFTDPIFIFKIVSLRFFFRVCTRLVYFSQCRNICDEKLVNKNRTSSIGREEFVDFSAIDVVTKSQFFLIKCPSQFTSQKLFNLAHWRFCAAVFDSGNENSQKRLMYESEREQMKFSVFFFVSLFPFFIQTQWKWREKREEHQYTLNYGLKAFTKCWKS